MAHVLTICGSLQRVSASKAVLRAVERTASAATRIVAFDLLANVPPFDFDSASAPELPAAISMLRASIDAADAVLIATPEYGHSIPGVLKNALDWLVGSGELALKPIGIITVSPTPTGGLRCMAALIATLLAQQAEIVALLSIAGVKAKLDIAGELADQTTLRRIAETMRALREAAPDNGAEPVQ